MKIPESVRAQLKKPVGRLCTDFRAIKKLGRGRHIVAIGDVCTLGLLAMGMRPHLAVFDHRFMRKRLDSGMVRILEMHYRRPKRYKNPPGTLSEKLVADAPKLLAEGGAVLIDGEEDLTALAFIRSAKKEIIVYGQPHEGMVIVVPDRKIKRKIEGWISAATAVLRHKIKPHK